MDIAIIADDLTGASDTGVQLAMRGISTIVPFSVNDERIANYEAIVLDTDSRADRQEIAYNKVASCSKKLLAFEPQFVYKKIDSTLRGNVGIELDAIYDVMQPELIVIAPTFPDLARVVKEGKLYVNHTLLHHTETARDVKTPVMTSYIPELIRMQSSQSVGLLTLEQLYRHEEEVIDSLQKLYQDGKRYIVFDAVTDAHLEQIVHLVQRSKLRTVWCGSAGLIKAIMNSASDKMKKQVEVKPLVSDNTPPLIVVGSVHAQSRDQMERLLQLDHICELELNATKLLIEMERVAEYERILVEYGRSAYGARAVVLTTTGRSEHVAEVGKEVSQIIAEALGECATRLIEQGQFSKLILTGGDTAKQVCTQLNCAGVELLYEVESGIPLSRLIGKREIYAMTKSGGFGDEDTLNRLIYFWEREE